MEAHPEYSTQILVFRLQAHAIEIVADAGPEIVAKFSASFKPRWVDFLGFLSAGLTELLTRYVVAGRTKTPKFQDHL